MSLTATIALVVLVNGTRATVEALRASRRPRIYYRPPPTTRPIRLVATFGAALLTAVALAYPHASLATGLQSLAPFTSALMAISAGVVVGATTAFAATYLRAPDPLSIAVAAGAGQLVGWSAHWLFFSWLRSDGAGSLESLTALISEPSAPIDALRAANRHGSALSHAVRITGNDLVLGWLAEPLLMVGSAAVAALVVASRLPFCRGCGVHCRGAQQVALLPYEDPGALKRKLEDGDVSDIETKRGTPSASTFHFLRVELDYCPRCDATGLLSVHLVERVEDRAGGLHELRRPFVRWLHLAPDAVERMLVVAGARPRRVDGTRTPTPASDPSVQVEVERWCAGLRASGARPLTPDEHATLRSNARSAALSGGAIVLGVIALALVSSLLAPDRWDAPELTAVVVLGCGAAVAGVLGGLRLRRAWRFARGARHGELELFEGQPVCGNQDATQDELEQIAAFPWQSTKPRRLEVLPSAGLVFLCNGKRPTRWVDARVISAASAPRVEIGQHRALVEDEKRELEGHERRGRREQLGLLLAGLSAMTAATLGTLSALPLDREGDWRIWPLFLVFALGACAIALAFERGGRARRLRADATSGVVLTEERAIGPSQTVIVERLTRSGRIWRAGSSPAGWRSPDRAWLASLVS